MSNLVTARLAFKSIDGGEEAHEEVRKRLVGFVLGSRLRSVRPWGVGFWFQFWSFFTVDVNREIDVKSNRI